MGDGTMPLDWGKNPQADWSRWLASDNARINAANELLKARAHIRELEAQLAAAEAAGVAKGLEMAVNYCRDCAKNFESISASATDQRTAAFSFNQKLTWEGAAENIAALSPPTGMVLVPREKLQRLIDYTVNPTPTNMDDRKALDWVNGQACAMLGATRE